MRKLFNLLRGLVAAIDIQVVFLVFVVLLVVEIFLEIGFRK